MGRERLGGSNASPAFTAGVHGSEESHPLAGQPDPQAAPAVIPLINTPLWELDRSFMFMQQLCDSFRRLLLAEDWELVGLTD